MKNNAKNYIVVHLSSTDGDIVLHPVSSDKELQEYVKDMHDSDYAIIENGQIKKAM